MSWKELNKRGVTENLKLTEFEYEQFMELFFKWYPSNAFKKSELTEHGRIVWKSNKEVYTNDVNEILMHSKKFHRLVHLNTASYCDRDGKTIFTDKELLSSDDDNREVKQSYISGEFPDQIINRYNGMISIKQSSTFHEWPVFPEYLDVICAWRNSRKTPMFPDEQVPLARL